MEKLKVTTIKIYPKEYKSYQEICKENNVSTSDEIRKFITKEVKKYKKQSSKIEELEKKIEELEQQKQNKDDEKEEFEKWCNYMRAIDKTWNFRKDENKETLTIDDLLKSENNKRLENIMNKYFTTNGY